MSPAAPQRRMADDAEARALASGLRLRILRLCLDEPLTNREIAEALGKNPASVLHHVRTLVDTGFLQAQEVRRGRRGAREIPYLATGKSWWLQTPASAGRVLEAFLDEIEQVPPEQHDLTRLGLRLPPAQMQEFRARLTALLEEFAARPRDPEADPWSLFVALHPDPSTSTQTATRRQGATPGPNQC
ncbi:helix-turn-helix domain-containing protein [Ornithinimicrobium sufpigmenti]|uniref:helix-turn-helix domain-containing protein n=1 Tax=Ornithinimicrobium sufpigmenti TaxID=2508882 RepID=UPI001036B775|nr:MULTISPECIES: helix-turn-helix domain-containing protein [unclassified Ornithinimicrobium]